MSGTWVVSSWMPNLVSCSRAVAPLVYLLLTFGTSFGSMTASGRVFDRVTGCLAPVLPSG
eukprot:1741805-Amphidinium_carterae.2